MVDGFRGMYRLLDKFAENDIDEMEHAFISALKWPDLYRIHINDKEFWEEIQKNYDICFTEEDKEEIITVGDLKKKIEECVIYDY